MKRFMKLALFALVLMVSISFVSAQDSDVEGIDFNETLSADEVDIQSDEADEELSAGNTIYISPDGTGTGSSEQDPTSWSSALNKANSGDTIQFANGNYTGINNVHQTISQSITLKGSGNSIIDAQQNGGFFSIGYSASVTLQNLSLINAYTGKHYDGPDGAEAPFNGEGGIINNGKLTIIDCIFDYNKGFGTEGGSIRNNGECNVYNSKFSRNSGSKGASIFCDENTILKIVNSTFTGGFSKKGNDIYSDKNARVTIINCTMGNAYGKSGLIVIKKSYLYMCGTYISGARSIDTAGVLNIDKESTVELYGCTFEKNTATGGVLLFNEKNETGDGDGGAIVIEKGAKNVIIKDCIFKDNYAKNRGGAIYVESTTSITIDNCTFEGNKAGFSGDNIYCFNYASYMTIKNSKFEVVSTIETSDIEYGETEVITVTTNDGTNGLLKPDYCIHLNNQEYALTNGKLSLNNLKSGNYTAILIGHDSNSNTYTFTQQSALFIVGGEELEATASYSFNDDGSLNVQVIDEYERPVANTEITVTIDGRDYSATTNSQGIAQIAPQLTVGEHNISLTVAGKIVSNSTPSKIEVINDTDVAITDEVSVSFSYNEDGTINVEVKDKYNRAVAGSEVKLTINGKRYNATTSGNGIAVINPDGNIAGEYEVKVEVTGKNVTSSPKTVKVMPTSKTSSIIADDTKRAFNTAFDFKARFLDKNANPLKNKMVTFILNGNEYEVATDEYGYAAFKNSLPVGTYRITLQNPATGEEAVKNLTIVNRITGNKNINIDYSYSGTFKVRVFADNGEAVGAGETVVFKIDGKNAKSVITDKNGYAAFTVRDNKLLPKTHTVTAEYRGVKVSNNLVVKQILKASNKKFKRYNLKTYAATLKTSSGKAIKGKTVKFTFNGKTYKAKTNSKGVAKITIKRFWKVGKFKITVSYLKTSIKKTITVKR